MKRIPTSQSGRVGGYRMEPDIMSWPRGSNINPVRIQSYFARKCCRRSNMLEPSSCGMLPPVTTRTGLPQVWPSTQKNVCRAMIASRRRLEADIGQGGAVRQRLGHHRFDRGALGRFERQARRAGEVRPASHDPFAKLDALDEIRAGVEVQERHEPLV